MIIPDVSKLPSVRQLAYLLLPRSGIRLVKIIIPCFRWTHLTLFDNIYLVFTEIWVSWEENNAMNIYYLVVIEIVLSVSIYIPDIVQVHLLNNIYTCISFGCHVFKLKYWGISYLSLRNTLDTVIYWKLIHS